MPTVQDILPDPFAWCEIPAGQVALFSIYDDYLPIREYKIFDVPAFAIAKYPVTNAQYELFIQMGGYFDKRWWTPEGWQAGLDGWMPNGGRGHHHKSRIPWANPVYWERPEFSGLDSPVAGISWHEAVAYCNWLSHVSSEIVTLPTEQQWQRAAQGDDGRKFPWGNDWDESRCKVYGYMIPTPVTHYEGKGDSPYGVIDMVGNCFEWCLTHCATGSNDILTSGSRVRRGGIVICHVEWRSYERTIVRDSLSGFRICKPALA